MTESDTEFDASAHEKLLASIEELGRPAGGKKRFTLRKHAKKASASDLVAAISSTRFAYKSFVSRKGFWCVRFC